MDESKMHKWATFWFFLPSSILLAYFVFYFTTATFSPTGGEPSTAQYRGDAPSQPSENLILTKGEPKIMGQIQLTYQGLNAGSIVLDITLLDMDPGYAYRRKIPKQVAKQGFWMAQQYYRLISAGVSHLEIIRVDG